MRLSFATCRVELRRADKMADFVNKWFWVHTFHETGRKSGWVRYAVGGKKNSVSGSGGGDGGEWGGVRREKSCQSQGKMLADEGEWGKSFRSSLLYPFNRVDLTSSKAKLAPDSYLLKD